MFCPANQTSPRTRAPGMVSCMRLRQRRRVDLPQPEGPMIAVTWRSGASNETPRTACVLPNQASRPSARTTGGLAAAPLTRSVSAAGIASTGDIARDDADDEDEADEDERSRPGLGAPPVVGAVCIDKDLEGKRGDRLVELS